MEAMHALDILTEDCWREVFKKVRTPEDLKSCSETCTTFEVILERKKSTWMFPTILPHVLPYLPIPAVGRVNARRHIWREDNWNALYLCRCVCRGWRQGVDHYLETHSSYFQGVDEPTAYEYDFFGESFAEFSEMFEDEDFTGNPFIGRYICIEDLDDLINPPQVEPNQNQRNGYHVSLRQVLNRFGGEIRSLSTQYPQFIDQLDFCKNIQILLNLLPNLRSLQLGEGGEFSGFYLRYRGREDPERGQLPAFLAANPLPDNPNLEDLVLAALNADMSQALLEKYGPQLKRLHLSHPVRLAENVHQLQCLKELEIWSFDANESLTVLRQLQSPLNILHIHVKYNDNRSTWPIHELIQNVLHLPITDLRISSYNYFERNFGAFPAVLQNHSILRLRITSYTSRSLSCNFLGCFPNLEEIHFDYPYGEIPRPGSPDNLLEVKKAAKDMYESTVWEVLPHLQIIKVESPYYPRINNVYRKSTFEKRRFEETKKILADLF